MSWVPCSGLDSEAGLVWLPRLLQKARRCLNSPDGRLTDGYCYGDNDFIDKPLIAFLRTDDETISALVRENPSDADVARMLVERSGRTPAECETFSRSFRRKFFDFILLEADEGRLKPGLKASVIKFLYNRALMPAVYFMFRRDERKRTGVRA
ncbi:MAG: hypothetical protein QOJ39_754 [Candidatus Eremiobacteraeota bacterium]|jgi:hypothetical protein|nr:hypothetical protein [Candidatus Eremiobacteraeota bacterium]